MMCKIVNPDFNPSEIDPGFRFSEMNERLVGELKDYLNFRSLNRESRAYGTLEYKRVDQEQKYQESYYIPSEVMNNKVFPNVSGAIKTLEALGYGASLQGKNLLPTGQINQVQGSGFQENLGKESHSKGGLGQ